MPAAPEDLEGSLRRGFAVVAFDYSSSAHCKPLPLTGAGAARLRTELAKAGAVDHLPAAATGSIEWKNVTAELEDLLLDGLGDGDTLCIYLGGHGRAVHRQAQSFRR